MTSEVSATMTENYVALSFLALEFIVKIIWTIRQGYLSHNIRHRTMTFKTTSCVGFEPKLAIDMAGMTKQIVPAR